MGVKSNHFFKCFLGSATDGITGQELTTWPSIFRGTLNWLSVLLL